MARPKRAPLVRSSQWVGEPMLPPKSLASTLTNFSWFASVLVIEKLEGGGLPKGFRTRWKGNPCR